MSSRRYKTCAREYIVAYEEATYLSEDEISKLLETVTKQAETYAREHKLLKQAQKHAGIVGVPILQDSSNVAEDFKKLFMDWLDALQSLGKSPPLRDDS
jgi:hypothetical protein